MAVPRGASLTVALLVLASFAGALGTCVGDGLPSVANDVTVIVCVKECAISGNATANLLAAVPPDVAVWLYQFQPYTDVEDVHRLEQLVERYENAHLVSSLPLYSTLGDARRLVRTGRLDISRQEAYRSGRHALENVVKTKYFLSVENIAYFKEGFVQRIYDIAETLREEEAIQHGEAKSVAFLPRMVERCDYDESMWSRRNHQSHSQFQPRIFSSEATGRKYLVQGYLAPHSSVKFESGDNEDREWGDESGALWDEWAAKPLPGESTGVEGTHSIDFLEDHIFLGETEFFYSHREYLCHNDLLWFEDHITPVAVIHAFGKRVIATSELTGYMEFFCQWNLETIHQVAWRRGDYLMARACELEEVVFGTTVTYNCWEWTSSIKNLMLSRVKVPDVIGSFPSFAPGRRWASLRHTNLIMALFLQASHTHFSFERRTTGAGENTPMGELVESSGWMEAMEALSWVHAEIGGPSSGEDKNTPPADTALYLSAKKEYVSVRSEEYLQKHREAGTLLQPLPGAFASLPHTNNADVTFPDGKEVITDLPDSCLYRTGMFGWHAAPRQKRVEVARAGLVIDYYVSPSAAQEAKVTEALFWSKCADGPFPSAEKELAQKVTMEDRIRIPSTPTDESVLVRSYSGRKRHL